MNREFKDALEDSPVIAAIKDDNGLKECLKSDIQVVDLRCNAKKTEQP